MTPSELRRKMENAGVDHDEIEAQVDRLADDLVQHDRDARLDQQLQELQVMGYTEHDLERSNPYNQWMHA